MTIRKIPVRGTELAYDIRGSGMTTVQLHGLTSSRRRDERIGLNLTSACEHVRVIRFDARGHGHSDGGTTEHEYTWPELAADLLALLDTLAPGEQVHAVGQSMGAATLLHAYLADPGRFASLSLIIPPTAWQWRVDRAAGYLQSASLIERFGVSRFIEAAGTQAMSPAIDPNRPTTTPDVPEALLPTVFRGAALTDLPDLSELTAVDIPVLVRAWIDDPSHPVVVAEELVSALPHANFTVSSTPDETARWPYEIAEFIQN